MTIQVRDKNTNKIITTVKTNDWTEMYIKFVDKFRRECINAKIEVFYGEPNGKPVTTYTTFH